MNNRQQISKEVLENTLQETRVHLYNKLGQKGYGTMASSHEILGVLQEEFTEYETEVHENSSDSDKIKELLDIAVAAIFGAASIDVDGVDW